MEIERTKLERNCCASLTRPLLRRVCTGRKTEEEEEKTFQTIVGSVRLIVVGRLSEINSQSWDDKVCGSNFDGFGRMQFLCCSPTASYIGIGANLMGLLTSLQLAKDVEEEIGYLLPEGC